MEETVRFPSKEAFFKPVPAKFYVKPVELSSDDEAINPNQILRTRFLQQVKNPQNRNLLRVTPFSSSSNKKRDPPVYGKDKKPNFQFPNSNNYMTLPTQSPQSHTLTATTVKAIKENSEIAPDNNFPTNAVNETEPFITAEPIFTAIDTEDKDYIAETEHTLRKSSTEEDKVKSPTTPIDFITENQQMLASLKELQPFLAGKYAHLMTRIVASPPRTSIGTTKESTEPIIDSIFDNMNDSSWKDGNPDVAHRKISTPNITLLLSSRRGLPAPTKTQEQDLEDNVRHKVTDEFGAVDVLNLNTEATSMKPFHLLTAVVSEEEFDSDYSVRAGGVSTLTTSYVDDETEEYDDLESPDSTATEEYNNNDQITESSVIDVEPEDSVFENAFDDLNKDQGLGEFSEEITNPPESKEIDEDTNNQNREGENNTQTESIDNIEYHEEEELSSIVLPTGTEQSTYFNVTTFLLYDHNPTLRSTQSHINEDILSQPYSTTFTEGAEPQELVTNPSTVQNPSAITNYNPEEVEINPTVTVGTPISLTTHGTGFVYESTHGPLESPFTFAEAVGSTEAISLEYTNILTSPETSKEISLVEVSETPKELSISSTQERFNEVALSEPYSTTFTEGTEPQELATSPSTVQNPSTITNYNPEEVEINPTVTVGTPISLTTYETGLVYESTHGPLESPFTFAEAVRSTEATSLEYTNILTSPETFKEISLVEVSETPKELSISSTQERFNEVALSEPYSPTFTEGTEPQELAISPSTVQNPSAITNINPEEVEINPTVTVGTPISLTTYETGFVYESTHGPLESPFTVAEAVGSTEIILETSSEYTNILTSPETSKEISLVEVSETPKELSISSTQERFNEVALSEPYSTTFTEGTEPQELATSPSTVQNPSTITNYNPEEVEINPTVTVGTPISLTTYETGLVYESTHGPLESPFTFAEAVRSTEATSLEYTNILTSPETFKEISLVEVSETPKELSISSTQERFNEVALSEPYSPTFTEGTEPQELAISPSTVQNPSAITNINPEEVEINPTVTVGTPISLTTYETGLVYESTHGPLESPFTVAEAVGSTEIILETSSEYTNILTSAETSKEISLVEVSETPKELSISSTQERFNEVALSQPYSTTFTEGTEPQELVTNPSTVQNPSTITNYNPEEVEINQSVTVGTPISLTTHGTGFVYESTHGPLESPFTVAEAVGSTEIILETSSEYTNILTLAETSKEISLVEVSEAPMEPSNSIQEMLNVSKAPGEEEQEVLLSSKVQEQVTIPAGIEATTGNYYTAKEDVISQGPSQTTYSDIKQILYTHSVEEHSTISNVINEVESANTNLSLTEAHSTAVPTITEHYTFEAGDSSSSSMLVPFTAEESNISEELGVPNHSNLDFGQTNLHEPTITLAATVLSHSFAGVAEITSQTPEEFHSLEYIEKIQNITTARMETKPTIFINDSADENILPKIDSMLNIFYTSTHSAKEETLHLSVASTTSEKSILEHNPSTIPTGMVGTFGSTNHIGNMATESSNIIPQGANTPAPNVLETVASLEHTKVLTQPETTPEHKFKLPITSSTITAITSGNKESAETTLPHIVLPLSEPELVQSTETAQSTWPEEVVGKTKVQQSEIGMTTLNKELNLSETKRVFSELVSTITMSPSTKMEHTTSHRNIALVDYTISELPLVGSKTVTNSVSPAELISSEAATTTSKPLEEVVTTSTSSAVKSESTFLFSNELTHHPTSTELPIYAATFESINNFHNITEGTTVGSIGELFTETSIDEEMTLSTFAHLEKDTEEETEAEEYSEMPSSETASMSFEFNHGTGSVEETTKSSVYLLMYKNVENASTVSAQYLHTTTEEENGNITEYTDMGLTTCYTVNITNTEELEEQNHINIETTTLIVPKHQNIPLSTVNQYIEEHTLHTMNGGVHETPIVNVTLLPTTSKDGFAVHTTESLNFTESAASTTSFTFLPHANGGTNEEVQTSKLHTGNQEVVNSILNTQEGNIFTTGAEHTHVHSIESMSSNVSEQYLRTTSLENEEENITEYTDMGLTTCYTVNITNTEELEEQNHINIETTTLIVPQHQNIPLSTVNQYVEEHTLHTMNGGVHETPIVNATLLPTTSKDGFAVHTIESLHFTESAASTTSFTFLPHANGGTNEEVQTSTLHIGNQEVVNSILNTQEENIFTTGAEHTHVPSLESMSSNVSEQYLHTTSEEENGNITEYTDMGLTTCYTVNITNTEELEEQNHISPTTTTLIVPQHQNISLSTVNQYIEEHTLHTMNGGVHETPIVNVTILPTTSKDDFAMHTIESLHFTESAASTTSFTFLPHANGGTNEEVQRSTLHTGNQEVVNSILNTQEENIFTTGAEQTHAYSIESMSSNVSEQYLHTTSLANEEENITEYTDMGLTTCYTVNITNTEELEEQNHINIETTTLIVPQHQNISLSTVNQYVEEHTLHTMNGGVNETPIVNVTLLPTTSKDDFAMHTIESLHFTESAASTTSFTFLPHANGGTNEEVQRSTLHTGNQEVVNSILNTQEGNIFTTGAEHTHVPSLESMSSNVSEQYLRTTSLENEEENITEYTDMGLTTCYTVNITNTEELEEQNHINIETTTLIVPQHQNIPLSTVNQYIEEHTLHTMNGGVNETPIVNVTILPTTSKDDFAMHTIESLHFTESAASTTSFTFLPHANGGTNEEVQRSTLHTGNQEVVNSILNTQEGNIFTTGAEHTHVPSLESMSSNVSEQYLRTTSLENEEENITEYTDMGLTTCYTVNITNTEELEEQNHINIETTTLIVPQHQNIPLSTVNQYIEEHTLHTMNGGVHETPIVNVTILPTTSKDDFAMHTIESLHFTESAASTTSFTFLPHANGGTNEEVQRSTLHTGNQEVVNSILNTQEGNIFTTGAEHTHVPSLESMSSNVSEQYLRTTSLENEEENITEYTDMGLTTCYTVNITNTEELEEQNHINIETTTLIVPQHQNIPLSTVNQYIEEHTLHTMNGGVNETPIVNVTILPTTSKDDFAMHTIESLHFTESAASTTSFTFLPHANGGTNEEVQTSTPHIGNQDVVNSILNTQEVFTTGAEHTHVHSIESMSSNVSEQYLHTTSEEEIENITEYTDMGLTTCYTVNITNTEELEEQNHISPTTTTLIVPKHQNIPLSTINQYIQEHMLQSMKGRVNETSVVNVTLLPTTSKDGFAVHTINSLHFTESAASTTSFTFLPHAYGGTNEEVQTSTLHTGNQEVVNSILNTQEGNIFTTGAEHTHVHSIESMSSNVSEQYLHTTSLENEEENITEYTDMGLTTCYTVNITNTEELEEQNHISPTTTTLIVPKHQNIPLSTINQYIQEHMLQSMKGRVNETPIVNVTLLPTTSKDDFAMHTIESLNFSDTATSTTSYTFLPHTNGGTNEEVQRSTLHTGNQEVVNSILNTQEGNIFTTGAEHTHVPSLESMSSNVSAQYLHTTSEEEIENITEYTDMGLTTCYTVNITNTEELEEQNHINIETTTLIVPKHQNIPLSTVNQYIEEHTLHTMNGGVNETPIVNATLLPTTSKDDFAMHTIESLHFSNTAASPTSYTFLPHANGGTNEEVQTSTLHTGNQEVVNSILNTQEVFTTGAEHTHVYSIESMSSNISEQLHETLSSSTTLLSELPYENFTIENANQVPTLPTAQEKVASQMEHIDAKSKGEYDHLYSWTTEEIGKQPVAHAHTTEEVFTTVGTSEKSSEMTTHLMNGSSSKMVNVKLPSSTHLEYSTHTEGSQMSAIDMMGTQIGEQSLGNLKSNTMQPEHVTITSSKGEIELSTKQIIEEQVAETVTLNVSTQTEEEHVHTSSKEEYITKPELVSITSNEERIELSTKQIKEEQVAETVTLNVSTHTEEEHVHTSSKEEYITKPELVSITSNEERIELSTKQIKEEQVAETVTLNVSTHTEEEHVHTSSKEEYITKPELVSITSNEERIELSTKQIKEEQVAETVTLNVSTKTEEEHVHTSSKEEYITKPELVSITSNEERIELSTKQIKEEQVAETVTLNVSTHTEEEHVHTSRKEEYETKTTNGPSLNLHSTVGNDSYVNFEASTILGHEHVTLPSNEEEIELSTKQTLEEKVVTVVSSVATPHVEEEHVHSSTLSKEEYVTTLHESLPMNIPSTSENFNIASSGDVEEEWENKHKTTHIVSTSTTPGSFASDLMVHISNTHDDRITKLDFITLVSAPSGTAKTKTKTNEEIESSKEAHETVKSTIAESQFAHETAHKHIHPNTTPSKMIAAEEDVNVNLGHLSAQNKSTICDACEVDDEDMTGDYSIGTPKSSVKMDLQLSTHKSVVTNEFETHSSTVIQNLDYNVTHSSSLHESTPCEGCTVTPEYKEFSTPVTESRETTPRATTSHVDFKDRNEQLQSTTINIEHEFVASSTSHTLEENVPSSSLEESLKTTLSTESPPSASNSEKIVTSTESHVVTTLQENLSSNNTHFSSHHESTLCEECTVEEVNATTASFEPLMALTHVTVQSSSHVEESLKTTLLVEHHPSASNSEQTENFMTSTESHVVTTLQENLSSNNTHFSSHHESTLCEECTVEEGKATTASFEPLMALTHVTVQSSSHVEEFLKTTLLVEHHPSASNSEQTENFMTSTESHVVTTLQENLSSNNTHFSSHHESTLCEECTVEEGKATTASFEPLMALTHVPAQSSSHVEESLKTTLLVEHHPSASNSEQTENFMTSTESHVVTTLQENLSSNNTHFSSHHESTLCEECTVEEGKATTASFEPLMALTHVTVQSSSHVEESLKTTLLVEHHPSASNSEQTENFMTSTESHVVTTLQENLSSNNTHFSSHHESTLCEECTVEEGKATTASFEPLMALTHVPAQSSSHVEESLKTTLLVEHPPSASNSEQTENFMTSTESHVVTTLQENLSSNNTHFSSHHESTFCEECTVEEVNATTASFEPLMALTHVPAQSSTHLEDILNTTSSAESISSTIVKQQTIETESSSSTQEISTLTVEMPSEESNVNQLINGTEPQDIHYTSTITGSSEEISESLESTVSSSETMAPFQNTINTELHYKITLNPLSIVETEGSPHSESHSSTVVPQEIDQQANHTLQAISLTSPEEFEISTDTESEVQILETSSSSSELPLSTNYDESQLTSSSKSSTELNSQHVIIEGTMGKQSSTGIADLITFTSEEATIEPISFYKSEEEQTTQYSTPPANFTTSEAIATMLTCDSECIDGQLIDQTFTSLNSQSQFLEGSTLSYVNSNLVHTSSPPTKVLVNASHFDNTSTHTTLEYSSDTLHSMSGKSGTTKETHANTISDMDATTQKLNVTTIEFTMPSIYIDLPTYLPEPIPNFTPAGKIVDLFDDERNDTTINIDMFRSMKLNDFKAITEFPVTPEITTVACRNGTCLPITTQDNLDEEQFTTATLLSNPAAISSSKYDHTSETESGALCNSNSTCEIETDVTQQIEPSLAATSENVASSTMSLGLPKVVTVETEESTVMCESTCETESVVSYSEAFNSISSTNNNISSLLSIIVVTTPESTTSETITLKTNTQYVNSIPSELEETTNTDVGTTVWETITAIGTTTEKVVNAATTIELNTATFQAHEESTTLSPENGTICALQEVSGGKQLDFELQLVTPISTDGNNTQCPVKDYNASRSCVCSIDMLLKDLKQKTTQREFAESVEKYMCNSFVPINKGIKLGMQMASSQIQDTRRSKREVVETGETEVHKRDVIQNAEILHALENDFQIRNTDKQVYATPGGEVKINCAPPPLESTTGTWQFNGKSLTEGKVVEGNSFITVDTIVPQDGGNYTCIDVHGLRHVHKLSVISLPFFIVNASILYEVNDICEEKNADSFEKYLSTALSDMLCGSELKICNLMVHNTHCVHKGAKDYLDTSIELGMEPLETIMPNLNKTDCDVTCQLKLYSRMVGILVKNLDIFQIQTVYFNASVQDSMVLRPIEAESNADHEGTAASKLIVSCAPGFGLIPGSHICEACLPNTFSAGDEAFCIDCPPATYQPTAGCKSCLTCTTIFDDILCVRGIIFDSSHFTYMIALGGSILVLLTVGMGFSLAKKGGSKDPTECDQVHSRKRKKRRRTTTDAEDVEKQDDFSWRRNNRAGRSLKEDGSPIGLALLRS